MLLVILLVMEIQSFVINIKISFSNIVNSDADEIKHRFIISLVRHRHIVIFWSPGIINCIVLTIKHKNVSGVT